MHFVPRVRIDAWLPTDNLNPVLSRGGSPCGPRWGLNDKRELLSERRPGSCDGTFISPLGEEIFLSDLGSLGRYAGPGNREDAKIESQCRRDPLRTPEVPWTVRPQVFRRKTCPISRQSKTTLHPTLFEDSGNTANGII